MGSEIAPVLFGPILVLCALVLFYLAISGRRRLVTSKSTLGLGRSRLAIGYLAVFVVCLAYAYWDTMSLSSMKVARGDVTQLQANQYFWGWYIYGFSLTTPFYFFFLTAVGLPTLAILRRYKLMSVVGVCACSQIIAFLLASLASLFFANDWCRSHGLRCVASYYTESVPLALAMALAFAVATRLPLFRWTEHAS